jgi:hypothetical protein
MIGAAVPFELFARFCLVFGPSPLLRLDRSSEYPDDATEWATQGVVNSGSAPGGHTTRKLEYPVANATLFS